MPTVVTVSPHIEFAAIRPVRKNARTYYMGSVMIGNVTVHATHLTGELLDEWSNIREPSEDVMKHLTEIVFEDSFGFGEILATDEVDSDGAEIVMWLPVTGNEYRAAWVNGNEFYVSKR